LVKTTTMETIYSKIFDNVRKEIADASEEQLMSDLYKEELEKEYTIEPPYLQKDLLSVEIKSKTLTDNNAPEGFDYTEGDVVNYAYYGIPIKGDDNLLKHKLEDLLKISNKFAIVKGFLFIEEYYFEKIEDNEVAIEAVKEAMLKDVAFLEQYIQQVNVEVESFKSTLTNKINTEIAIELDKRRVKQETIDKLNPFD
jgi:hypothetical protein